MDFAAWEKGKKKMDELKKCPFCGGKAALLANNDVKVSCLTCAAQTDSHIDFMTRPREVLQRRAAGRGCLEQEGAGR